MQLFPFSAATRVVLAMVLILGRAAAAESFRLLPRSQEIPERGPVAGGVIVTETNRFSFLLPLNWKVTENASQRTVTFVSRTLNASITCKVLYGRKVPPDFAALRAEVAVRFPRAKILDGFDCYTRSGPGMGCDLEQREAGMRVSRRIAFVGFRGGVFEFELFTSAKDLAEPHRSFANLLNSFAVEPMSP